MLRAGAEQTVDGPLSPGEEVHTAVEDGGHVRAQVPPREPEGDDKSVTMVQRKAHLEPLGLEQGDPEVDEDEDGHGQEDRLVTQSYVLQPLDERQHRDGKDDDAQH